MCEHTGWKTGWYLLLCRCVFLYLYAPVSQCSSHERWHPSCSQYRTIEWLFLHEGILNTEALFIITQNMSNWLTAVACLGQCAACTVSCSEKKYCSGTSCEPGHFLGSILLTLCQRNWILKSISLPIPYSFVFFFTLLFEILGGVFCLVRFFFCWVFLSCWCHLPPQALRTRNSINSLTALLRKVLYQF